MRFGIIFICLALLLTNTLTKSIGLNFWVAIFMIGALAGLIELAVEAFKRRELLKELLNPRKIELDKLPFVVTVMTMKTDGTGDVEVIGHSATEELARTALEIAIKEQVEKFAASDPLVTRESDGTVMLHTKGWSKVFRLENVSA